MLKGDRDEIERLLATGLSSAQVAEVLKVSIPQVAAVKAHRTMSTRRAAESETSVEPERLAELDLSSRPLKTHDKTEANPLDVQQWDFFVAATSSVNAVYW